MAKEKETNRSCVDCIHEFACRMWTDGRVISDESASRCPQYTEPKASAAYLCGVLDTRNLIFQEQDAKVVTNGERIRAMSDEELAQFLAERSVNEYTVSLLCKDDALTAVQIEAQKHRIYCAFMKWLKQPAEVK